jgi:hypothetical protein
MICGEVCGRWWLVGEGEGGLVKGRFGCGSGLLVAVGSGSGAVVVGLDLGQDGVLLRGEAGEW